MSTDAQPLTNALLAYLRKLIDSPAVPELPPELAGLNASGDALGDVPGDVTDIVNGVEGLRDQLIALRDILDAFSRGDFSPEIRVRGIMAGRLKTLQANLLHLCWQIQQVADGDFSQRVEFMGEFSAAFNSMVEQLDTALTALRQKEEELTNITEALQREVRQKAEALTALSKSEARFRYMAEHDSLTGVYNRRSFYDMAVMDIERARKEGQPCVLVMFDIDHFKNFNDTYGHLEGDAALRHVTQAAKAQLREQDLFGRYGGEEFILLLPNLERKQGAAVAERVRAAVASTPVKTAVSPVTVTVSIGVVAVPPQSADEPRVDYLEKLLSHADTALYEAKGAGRNRVVVSTYPE